MNHKKKYSHIIWDWNGTLLDDVHWCTQQVNRMLVKRKLKPFAHVQDYRRVFGFPIIDYYRRAGFDFAKEPFEAISAEYLSLYHANKTGRCGLHPNAEQVLQQISQQGISQVILSASEQERLLSQLGEFDIEKHFEKVLGLPNTHARSKVNIGLDYIKDNRVTAALLVGDTSHDYEVAAALGADCLLVANGHQTKETLAACGVPVLDNLVQVLEYVA